ncbi:MAG: TfoX/Sxy family protein [Acidimicrobiia bacterium]
MPYSDDLADRVRTQISHLDSLTERPVMNGLGFFLEDRMVVAVLDNRLCLRLGETEGGAALADTAAHPFEFAGRAVQGWVCIPEESLDEAGLVHWVARGVAGLGLSM